METKYYVYFHKTLSGDVFYIGKGCDQRAWSKYSRSSSWFEVASSGYTVEIFKDSLSEHEALVLESELISSYLNLVNTGVQSKLEFADLSEYFKVDATSPSGLSRIKGNWTGVYFAGKLGPCGNIRKEKGISLGWKVRHQNKTLYAHRAIWELINGKVPDGFVIDHIDGNPLNNNIENLRVVSVEVNSRNKKLNNKNSTGVSGVRLKANGYEVRVVFNSKQVFKRFSISKLGKTEAFKMACEFRQKTLDEFNSQGAGYTTRHGT